MPLPPVEPGPRGMTRRHYLVEMNRRRVAAYEPTRQKLQEEELRLAQTRAAEREEMRATWSQKTATNAAGDSTRPLPGGGPRSMRMKATQSQRNEFSYKEEKAREAQEKAAYHQAYEAEMKAQLMQREATLKKMRDDEAAQMTALRELVAEQEREAAEQDRQAKEEEKAYIERLQESNRRAQEAKRAAEKAQEERDAVVQRTVQENNRHRAEMEERQQKNLTKMLRLQNEEYHKEASRRVEHNRAREVEEMNAAITRDRQLAEEERQANEAKKERFRREFDECVERDREFRRTHNYEESMEETRRRNELAAQTYHAIRQEERLRDSMRKKEYGDELMEQIQAKQEYLMTHLDGL